MVGEELGFLSLINHQELAYKYDMMAFFNTWVLDFLFCDLFNLNYIGNLLKLMMWPGQDLRGGKDRKVLYIFRISTYCKRGHLTTIYFMGQMGARRGGLRLIYHVWCLRGSSFDKK